MQISKHFIANRQRVGDKKKQRQIQGRGEFSKWLWRKRWAIWDQQLISYKSPKETTEHSVLCLWHKDTDQCYVQIIDGPTDCRASIPVTLGSWKDQRQCAFEIVSEFTPFLPEHCRLPEKQTHNHTILYFYMMLLDKSKKKSISNYFSLFFKPTPHKYRYNNLCMVIKE